MQPISVQKLFLLYAKLSIKIDTPKCLKMTVVMLVRTERINFTTNDHETFLQIDMKRDMKRFCSQSKL